MKICIKCNEKRPLTEFYKHVGMADGHLNKCRKCCAAYTREYYRKNIDKCTKFYKKRNEERRSNGDQAARLKRYASANPQKRKAHHAVSNALRDGKIQRLPCRVCGATERVEAHHDDYSKPLCVTWLCFKHHREIHGQEVRQ